MKLLKLILAFAVGSLVLFYIAATLMEGTLNLQKMEHEARATIFGIWLAIVVIGSFGIFMHHQIKD
jgi:hypothetical protein